MESALAVLLVLSLPVIAIAGLASAIGARDRVRTLEQRFDEFQMPRPADSVASPPPATILAEGLPPLQTAATPAHA